MIIILIAAAVLSILLGEWVDASVILAIVALNAIIGVVQESKAEASLAALKKMSAPNARVIRDGQQQTIPARDLVVGDLVMVEAGNYLPADLRLVEAVNLKSEEASLTGESVPVDKNAQVVLEPDAPLGDRDNMAFMSMLVTYGRGTGIVTATGMDTQLGQIAEMLQTGEEELTPLQVKLDQLGKTLGIVCLSICGFILVFSLIRDTNPAMAFQKGLGAYWGKHGIMDRPPRPVGEPIINQEMTIGIAVQSVVMTVAILASYLMAGAHPGASLNNPDLSTWRTVAFATLTLSELLRAFTARSERISVFKLGFFSNKTMIMAVIFSIITVFVVIYVPFLQFVFGTVPLPLNDWLWVMPFALMASIAAELTKIYLRARAKRIETAQTAQMELA